MPLLAIRCCYLCYMCCVMVIMLTAAISISTYLTFCFSQYDLVIDNWKSDVLLQLRVSRDKCNKNEQQLILYTWPGTKSACDCRENTAWAIEYLLNERTPRKQIYVGDTCNSTQRFYGCYSIYQTRIQQLKYFSDQEGQKFTFCAQYGYGQNYYPPNQECLKGNICGQKKQSEFCLKSDICPIYDFGFGDPPEGAIQQDNGFWISRQSDQHLPIVKIQVGEGEGICTNPKQLPITKGREDFILMKNQKIDCERDQRYIKMLSTSETKFYEVNNMNTIIKKLIFMETDANYEWNLYKSHYLIWKDECRDQYLQLFNKQGNNQFLILLIWKSIIIILSISILLTIFLICNGNNVFHNDWFLYDIQFKDIQIQFFAKENIFKFTIYLIFIIFIGVSTKKVNDIRDSIYVYSVMNCSDEYTNILLEREVYELDQYEQQIEAFISFIIILIFIDLVIALTFIFNICLKKDQPQEYQQLDQPVENPIIEQIEEQQDEQLQIQTDQG